MYIYMHFVIYLCSVDFQVCCPVNVVFCVRFVLLFVFALVKHVSYIVFTNKHIGLRKQCDCNAYMFHGDHGDVSEWVIKFSSLLGTADIWVHVVHTSRVIKTHILESLSFPT